MVEVFAPGVACLSLGFVNVYFLGKRGEPWFMVDAGLPGKFEAIRAAAEERYGTNARPEAILLTHGHPDHIGSALALATFWNVPVYAHRMELPYLTGKADYPPVDPTVGGFVGQMSRFLPGETADLSAVVQALPDDGTVPGSRDWQWILTDGHSPGNVTFFREENRVAIVGDAFATMDLDRPLRVLTKAPRLSRPPAMATYDWLAVRKSVLRIADLEPNAIGAGHGVPLVSNLLGSDLRMFGEDFMIPLKGRYIADPVQFDENGIVYLPPIVPDPLPKVAAGIGLAAVLGVSIGIYLWNKNRNQEKQQKDNDGESA